MSETEETLPRATVQKIIKGEQVFALCLGIMSNMFDHRDLDESGKRTIHQRILLRKGDRRYSELGLSRCVMSRRGMSDMLTEHSNRVYQDDFYAVKRDL